MSPGMLLRDISRRFIIIIIIKLNQISVPHDVIVVLQSNVPEWIHLSG